MDEVYIHVPHSWNTQGLPIRGKTMSKRFAPVLAAAAMLGVVGGVAATQAFKPAEQPHQQVQFVQPAAETVTPSPTTTTVTVAPKPKPVQRQATPVTSTTSSSKAPSTVQRQAIVSETPTDPTPVQTPAPVTKPVRGNGTGRVVNDPYATPEPPAPSN